MVMIDVRDIFVKRLHSDPLKTKTYPSASSLQQRSVTSAALQQSVQKQLSQGVAKCREEVQVVRNEQVEEGMG